MVLTQIQHSSEPDMLCHRVAPLSPQRACPQDRFPLNGRWLNQDSFRSLPQEDANNDRPENAHLGPPHSCWRRDALQPLRCSGTSRPGTLVFTFRLEALDPSLGIREDSLALLLPHNVPHKEAGNRSTITLHCWPGITTSFVFNKHCRRMNSYKRFRYYSLNSGCLVHSR